MQKVAWSDLLVSDGLLGWNPQPSGSLVLLGSSPSDSIARLTGGYELVRLVSLRLHGLILSSVDCMAKFASEALQYFPSSLSLGPQR